MRRREIWDGRVVEEDGVMGYSGSGLESVSVSSLGSHSSSSAIASFKRL